MANAGSSIEGFQDNLDAIKDIFKEAGLDPELAERIRDGKVDVNKVIYKLKHQITNSDVFKRFMGKLVDIQTDTIYLALSDEIQKATAWITDSSTRIELGLKELITSNIYNLFNSGDYDDILIDIMVNGNPNDLIDILSTDNIQNIFNQVENALNEIRDKKGFGLRGVKKESYTLKYNSEIENRIRKNISLYTTREIDWMFINPSSLRDAGVMQLRKATLATTILHTLRDNPQIDSALQLAEDLMNPQFLDISSDFDDKTINGYKDSAVGYLLENKERLVSNLGDDFYNFLEEEINIRDLINTFIDDTRDFLLNPSDEKAERNLAQTTRMKQLIYVLETMRDIIDISIFIESQKGPVKSMQRIIAILERTTDTIKYLIEKRLDNSLAIKRKRLEMGIEEEENDKNGYQDELKRKNSDN